MHILFFLEDKNAWAMVTMVETAQVVKYGKNTLALQQQHFKM